MNNGGGIPPKKVHLKLCHGSEPAWSTKVDFLNCILLFIIMLSVDNEWKTRFETQQEMNNQLEKQVVLLRDKLGQLKIPSRDGKLTLTFEILYP